MAEPKLTVRIYNSRNGETSVYKEAFYTKIDGVYGYLCVDGLTVKFFWVNDGQACCDHVTYFTVHYSLVG